ncbi:hypothetical protein C1N70_26695 (plasmid) [Cytobacillus firmus]
MRSRAATLSLGLQSVGLEIIRHGIISIKGFSHSFLIDENPQLYRTIIFAVNDVLENIPDRHNFHDKQLLLQYINEFIAFSTNLEKSTSSRRADS